MKLELGSEVIRPIWDRFHHLMEYNCYYSVERARPLIRTKGGTHVVGSILKENGSLILLPSINFQKIQTYEIDDDGDPISDVNDNYVWSEEIKRFAFSLRDSLFEIDGHLNSQREVRSIPDWVSSSDFRIKDEEEIELSITEISAKIAELEKLKSEEEDRLISAGTLRNLLFSKGADLEQTVRLSLEIIGFSVEHYRDQESEFDIILTSSEGRFLGEIEGKDSKAINVEKISQLQRNITEDFARDEIEQMALGVLFGNGLRLTHPNSRGSQFTDKVQTVAKTFQTRLVATSDLFYVARYVKETRDMEFAERCRSALRDAGGGIVSFPPVPQTSLLQEQIKVQGADV